MVAPLVVAAWIADALATYAVSEVLTELTGHGEDDKWAALFARLNEMDSRLLSIEISTGANTSPEYSIKDKLEDAEDGLTALHQAVTNAVQDIMATTGYGTGNLYSLLVQVLARVAPGETPPPLATSSDTALLLGALYYIANAVIVPAWSIDNSEVLTAVEAAKQYLAGDHTALQTSVNSLDGALVTHDADIKAAIAGIEIDTQPILDAIDAIPTAPPPIVAPVWPGLSGVTLSNPVSLSDDPRIVGPMDGVLVTITTPPSKVGVRNIGGAMFDYNSGEVAFETDNGEVEPWQYLGFRDAIFTPKTMKRAGAVRFRVLAGAEGVVQCWTINP